MKYLKKISKLAVMMGAVIVLSTLGIDAYDNRNDISGSLLGSAIGITPKERSLCPGGMSYVQHPEKSFCIDTYTASAGEDCPYPDPKTQEETRINILSLECKAVSQKGRVPWRYISQTQAQEVCQKVGKFLPTGEQWFYSARGTAPNALWSESECNLDNNWVRNPGETGSASGCVSYAGSFDHVGNVWEWVNDVVKDGVMRELNLPNSGYVKSVDIEGIVLETDSEIPDESYTEDRFWINPEGVRGVMRGGFYGSGTDGGVYSMHAEMTPDFAGRAVGFRCAGEVLR